MNSKLVACTYVGLCHSSTIRSGSARCVSCTVWHDSEPTLFDFRHIANLHVKMPLLFLPLFPPLCRLPSQSPLQVSPLPCFSLCSAQSYPSRPVLSRPPL